MRRLKVKLADCSADRLIRVAEQCGFIVESGGSHYKVRTSKGITIVTIPRHSRIKREMVRKITKRFNEFGGEIEIS